MRALLPRRVRLRGAWSSAPTGEPGGFMRRVHALLPTPPPGGALRGRRLAAAAAAAAKGGLPDAAAVLQFERDGFVALPGLLDAAEAERLCGGVLAAARAEEEAALRQNVRVLLGEEYVTDELGFDLDGEELSELLELNGAEVPFLQCFNLWRECAAAREMAFHPHLVAAAALLLGCETSELRLYQDSTFVKRPGDGPTQFHVDLHMAPLDTNRHVTLWVPLQPVPAQEEGGTGLTYARGSHRDVSLHFWGVDCEDLSGRYEFASAGAVALGGAVAHHGWCLHGAPAMDPDEGGEARGAHAVSYFVDGCRVLRGGGGREVEPEDRDSYQAWLGDVGAGTVARHALLPLVAGGGGVVKEA